MSAPLRVARAVLNWKLRESADIIGIAPGFLSQIESGVKCPSPDMLERIRAAYGDALRDAEAYYGPVTTNKVGRPKAMR